MKKTFILLPLICGLLYVALSGNTAGPGISSGAERTGASGGTTGCGGAGCHATASTGASVGVTIQLMSGASTVTSYTPGASYTIRITGVNTSSSASVILPRFGFQVSAMKTGSTTVNAGALTAPAGTHTVTVSGINLVEHSSPIVAASGTGGPATTYLIDVPWTAPAAGTGSVTLRTALNAVNFNGLNTGDVNNTATATVTESTSVAAITGTATLCVGGTTTLSDATTGGTWSSGSTGIATVGASTGIVTGIAPGTAVISYNAGASGTATMTVTVNANPASISGIPAVCPGGVTTLVDGTGGGTWSSSATGTATVGSSTGIVTGVASGTALISYILSTGCYATVIVTVNTVPSITGTGTMCVGGSTTLAHSIPGGAWTSGATGIATVGSTSGVVTGVAAGTAVITYSFGSSGCYATTVVTVNGAPVAGPISGPDTVCVGYHITLTGATAGGTWTSLATTKATVGATSGIVAGVATGTATIKYKVTTACGTDSITKVIVVKAVTAGGCNVGTVNTAVISGELHVYPNPNKGAFTLSLLSNTNDDAHIIITNLVGTRVDEFTISSNKATDIKLNQPPGVYFIMAISGDKKYVAKVMVE